MTFVALPDECQFSQLFHFRQTCADTDYECLHLIRGLYDRLHTVSST